MQKPEVNHGVIHGFHGEVNSNVTQQDEKQGMN